jgi:molecular chaperone DnaK
LILQKLKESVERYIGEPVRAAVVTIPTHSTELYRRAVIKAGQIAGLEVIRLVNSSTAEALQYARDHRRDGTIAVIDFGGGTFDISILEVSEGVVEVKASNGLSGLGGDKFDQAIIDWILDEFLAKEGIDLRREPEVLARLKDASERAKIELSTSNLADISIPYIHLGSSGYRHIHHVLTRHHFEELIEPLLQQLNGPCENAMKDAKLTHLQIDNIFLVGGSSQIPRVQTLLKSIFTKAPQSVLHPFESAAQGAAILAGSISGEQREILLLDATSMSLGICANDGQMSVIIPRNTTFPTARSEVYTTTVDNQDAVDIEVFQGERLVVEGNKLLGHFRLGNIAPAPRGKPQIEVIFDIDASGLVRVTAKDKGTGRDLSVTIDGTPGTRPQRGFRPQVTPNPTSETSPPMAPAKTTIDGSPVDGSTSYAAKSEDEAPEQPQPGFLRRLTRRLLDR